MLPYVLFGLIAIVSVAIVVDLVGARKMKQGRKRNKGGAFSRAMSARTNLHSDFPPTTFGIDELDSAETTNRRPQPQRKSATLQNLEARAPVNVFPMAAETPETVGHAKPKENFGKLVATALGESQTNSSNRSAATAEFSPDETNIHLPSFGGSTAVAQKKREGMLLKTFSSMRLVSLSGQHKGKTFPVLAAGTVVGRHPSCNVVVSDPRVSSRHAWLGVVNGKVVLRDLQSTNGTLLNAQANRLTSETELRSGDTIFVGGQTGIQFRLMID
jgi:hypothetical protein